MMDSRSATKEQCPEQPECSPEQPRVVHWAARQGTFDGEAVWSVAIYSALKQGHPESYLLWEYTELGFNSGFGIVISGPFGWSFGFMLRVQKQTDRFRPPFNNFERPG